MLLYVHLTIRRVCHGWVWLRLLELFRQGLWLLLGLQVSNVGLHG
jgi:hypothetical protein